MERNKREKKKKGVEDLISQEIVTLNNKKNKYKFFAR